MQCQLLEQRRLLSSDFYLQTFDSPPAEETTGASATLTDSQTVVAPFLDADASTVQLIGLFAQPLYEVNTGVPNKPVLRVFRNVGGADQAGKPSIFEMGITIGDQSAIERAYQITVRRADGTGSPIEFIFSASAANGKRQLVKDELGRMWARIPGLPDDARYTVTAQALGPDRASATVTTHVFPALLPAISFDAPAVDSPKYSLAMDGGEGQAMATSQSTAPVFAIPQLESWDMGYYGEIIDPHLVTDLGTLRLIENVYSTLVQRGEPTGQQSFYDLMPELAEYWEVSQDLTVYTFDLREGVKFHDGVPLTADDVVFSLQRIQGLGVRSWQFPAGMTVEAEDADTVKVILSQDPLVPHVPLLSYLAHPLNAVISKAACYNRGDPAQSVLLSNSGGSGEYLLSEVVAHESAVLMLNEEYFLDNSSLPEALVARVYADAGDAILDFVAGYVDNIPDLEAYRPDLASLSALPGVQIDYVDVDGDEAPDGNRMTFLLTNRQDENSPFADDRVRQAVSLLLDRQTFADDILEGLAVPAAGPIAPWHAYYDGDLPIPAYDNSEAETLLIEAGYEPGVNPLALSLLAPIDPSSSYVPALWLQTQLGEVGVNVTVTYPTTRDAYWAALQAGDYDLALATWAGDQDPDSWTYGLLHSQGAWGFALSGDDTAETDGLLTAARPLGDPAERGELYDQVQGLSAEGPPLIYLTSDRHITARWLEWEPGQALNVPASLTGMRSVGAVVAQSPLLYGLKVNLSDPANPTNKVTTDDFGPFFIEVDSADAATIAIRATSTSGDSDFSTLLWKAVREDSPTAIASGSFSSGAEQTADLSITSTAARFVINLGFDSNNNSTLDESEYLFSLAVGLVKITCVVSQDQNNPVGQVESQRGDEMMPLWVEGWHGDGGALTLTSDINIPEAADHVLVSIDTYDGTDRQVTLAAAQSGIYLGGALEYVCVGFDDNTDGTLDSATSGFATLVEGESVFSIGLFLGPLAEGVAAWQAGITAHDLWLLKEYVRGRTAIYNFTGAHVTAYFAVNDVQAAIAKFDNQFWQHVDQQGAALTQQNPQTAVSFTPTYSHPPGEYVQLQDSIFVLGDGYFESQYSVAVTAIEFDGNGMATKGRVQGTVHRFTRDMFKDLTSTGIDIQPGFALHVDRNDPILEVRQAPPVP